MSVRGLVTVVIGVNGALAGQPARQYSSNSGKPKPKGKAILSQAKEMLNLFGRVQRLDGEHPSGMKRKSTLIGNCEAKVRSLCGEMKKLSPHNLAHIGETLLCFGGRNEGNTEGSCPARD